MPHVNLAPACNAGPHIEPVWIERDVLRQLARELRPVRSWSHDRHLPAQHMEELRQSIQAGAGEDPADAAPSGGNPEAAEGEWPVAAFPHLPLEHALARRQTHQRRDQQ
jgi:hypothetical protein